MRNALNKDDLVAELARRGAMTSAEIQKHFGASQPTVSRLLASLDDELILMGAARSTRYALAEPIGKFAAQQPIFRIDADGFSHRLGTLSFLAKSEIHVGGDGVNLLFEPARDQQLPWFLSGLKAQGFLGRILAKNLAGEDIDSNPETWDTRASLIAALHTHDAPGALLIGNNATKGTTPVIPGIEPARALDTASLDIAKTLPTGSSAGGEQPKFLAANESGDALIVKFSPPRNTAYGDRWNDLLCAEELCAHVLSRVQIAAAQTRVVQTDTRTYLISRRFDRTPQGGRKHVVSVGAAHHGFVRDIYRNWGATCEALSKKGKLSANDAATAQDVLQFGRLIGNTDMHSGNLSLYVEGASLQKILEGQFSLAPVYDMLPMRWRPDVALGLIEYQPFDLDLTFASAAIRRAAKEFWTLLSTDKRVSPDMQHTAKAMSQKLGDAPSTPAEV
jgi:hypothetical protein